MVVTNSLSGVNILVIVSARLQRVDNQMTFSPYLVTGRPRLRIQYCWNKIKAKKLERKP
jgi:hypothetical protein